MEVSQAIKTRRSIRRFRQEPIPDDILFGFVEAARCAPSGGNCQPLEFIVVNGKGPLEQIFPQLAWAGHVRPRRNPPADKRPVAYIVVLINTAITQAEPGQSQDAAAAIENILLSAQAKGVGSCWLGAIKRDQLIEILQVPDKYVIDSIVALGYSDEEPVMEDAQGDAVKYYLDEDDRLHVPKRPLETIMHINEFTWRP